jgi:hypothetical protein
VERDAKRLTDQFGAVVTEHSLVGWAGVEEGGIGVNDRDDIASVLDERSEASVRPFEHFLGLFALRQITGAHVESPRDRPSRNSLAAGQPAARDVGLN